MTRPAVSPGQALALFALFLIVLLGAGALAVDYANWLLNDRQLQNISDHAALAGASQFSSDFSASSCSGGTGTAQCLNARSQAWASLSQELNLGLSDATIASLAATNTPSGGQGSVVQGGSTVSFGHTIWVSTPPPSGGGHTEYTGVGGLYADSFGVIFVRVDRPTRSFLGGVFGIAARDRIGWATAGILPTDFALEIFCRNNTAPEHGVCAAGGSSLGIDGGGGITLTKGDIGSNNSLQVTAQTGQGVIVKAGNVFLVEGSCGPSTWNCPPATAGGISDGSGTAKNAFYIPPNPVLKYALPTGAGTLPWSDSGAPDTACSSAAPCIPGTGGSNATPMDWACGSAWSATYSNSYVPCGIPTVTTTAGVSTVQCTGGGVATRHLHPASDNLVTPSSLWNIGGPGKVNGGGNKYLNVGGKDATHDDTAVDPSGTVLPAPPTTKTFPSSPTANSYVYSTDGQSSGSGQGYRVTLSSPNGSVSPSDFLYARYVTFKTTNGTYDSANGGYGVTVTVAVQDNASGSWVTLGVPVSTSATGTITAYQTPAIQGSDLIAAGDPAATHLSLLFTIGTTAANPSIRPRDPSVRGAGISWSEAYLDHDPVPPPPPMIPPGLYRSILIPDETGVHGCAILDPTGYYSGGLKQYQMPGVYYFKDASGGGKNAQISIGDNSFLIGDGVTLVFDSNWPDPTGTGGSAGAHGIQIGSNGALIVNSGISGGYNPSDPLAALPHDALSAAWQVDPTNPSTGISTWGGPCTSASPCTVPRSSYLGQSGSDRGVSFYFKPKTNGSTDQADFDILGRFSMGGNVAGISFRGILYAPFDDVQISGANGFDTVGMVLAWTAKFNGGSASINLDYPYERIEAPPYLLEPGVTQ